MRPASPPRLPLEGLTYAALVSSTIARGRIAAIDTAAADGRARRRPGDDARERAADEGAADRVQGSRQGRGRHGRACGDAGRPGSLERPAGRGRARRDAGAGGPRRDADPRSPTPPSPPASISRPPRPRRSRPENILGEPAAIAVGDAGSGAALRPATGSTQTYRTPRHNHCAIELHAVTVAWEGDDRLTVHDATQALHGTQATLADVFGLDAGAGAGELAVRRRRLRQQDGLGPSDPGDRGGEAGTAAGASGAVARGGVPGHRRAHHHRAARGAGGARGRLRARGADPHRRRGQQPAQRMARAVHLPGPPPLCGGCHEDRSRRCCGWT